MMRGKRGGSSRGRAGGRPAGSHAAQSSSPDSSSMPRRGGYQKKRAIPTESADEVPMPAKKQKAPLSASKPASGAVTGSKQPNRAESSNQQGQTRKRSNGDVILHTLGQMGEAPSNPNVSSQVHYPTLPKNLLDESALKAVLMPFGKIVKIDMNYVGRGALVTFASANSAQKAMSGAVLPNGKMLKGSHPAPLTPQITKKGRNFQTDGMPSLTPALGRHNMDDDDIDIPQLPAPTKSNSRFQEGDKPNNKKKTQFQPSMEDEEDDTPPARPKKGANKTNAAQSMETPVLQRHNAKNMNMSFTAHAPILEKARSTTNKWVTTSSKKTQPTTFARFGTVSNAMDIDPYLAQDDDDENGDESDAAPQVARFSTFDPTTTRAGLELGVIQPKNQKNGAIGRPTAMDPELVRQISSKIQEASDHSNEASEDDNGDDEEEEQPSGAANGRRSMFAGNSDDQDDEEDDWGYEKESHPDDDEHEHDDGDDTEADAADVEDEYDDGATSELSEEAGEEVVEDEEEALDDEEEISDDVPSSPSPPPAKPIAAPTRSTIPPPIRKPVIASKGPKNQFKGTIGSLSEPLNPLRNLGCLNALYDQGKHIWHTAIERNEPLRAVSSFQRPAGGDDIPPPERVRPVSYLYSALEVIEENGEDAMSDGSATRLEFYNYALNRFRQILKELTQQSTMCLLSCYVAETIARRALRMKAELMLEDVEPDEAFDTGREKVLENAFEMCKNIYTFYASKCDMHVPFRTEIMSYYLLYRLRDGPKTYLPSFLDSIASVFLKPDQNNAPSDQKSNALAELRYDSNLDLVSQVIEILASNNWSALRVLCTKASYLHLCAFADLIPEFAYYALPMCFAAFRDSKAAKVAIPASYLQYHFFIKGDKFIQRMLIMGIGEGEKYNNGTHLEISNEKSDTFYPLAAATGSKSKKQPQLYLPPDMTFWAESKDQVIKLLSLLPPTFLYSTTSEPPIDHINALQVYLRWAANNLFQDEKLENRDNLTFSDITGDDDYLDAPIDKKSSYIIPKNLFTASTVYERAIERSLGNISGFTVSPVSMATSSSSNVPTRTFKPISPAANLPAPAPVKSKFPPPPTKKQPSAIVKQPATTPVIVQPAPFASKQPSGSKMQETPQSASIAPQPPRIVLDSPAASPPPTVAAITEAQIALIKEELQREMKNQTDALVAAFAQREQQLSAQLETLKSVEQEMVRYTELGAQRQAYLEKHPETAPSLSLASTTPGKLAKKQFAPILPLNLPQIVGPHVAQTQVEKMLQSPFPLVLTFKLLVNLSDDMKPAYGSIEYWLHKKMSMSANTSTLDSYTPSSGFQSPHLSNLTCIQSQIDLSPSNPFNTDIDWLNDLNLKPQLYPSLATVVNNLSTANLSEGDEVELQQALRGTQGFLFFLPFDFSRFESEDAYWNHHRNRLMMTLRCVSSWRRLPLVILYGPGLLLGKDEISAQPYIASHLNLAQIVETQCSHALVLRLTGNPNSPDEIFHNALVAARTAEQLEYIFASFAMMPVPLPEIKMTSLAQMLASHVETMFAESAHKYRQMVDLASRSSNFVTENENLTPLNAPQVPLPSDFINHWTHLLQSLDQALRDEGLLRIDWPAPESYDLFSNEMAALGWPDALWNTAQRLDLLTEKLKSVVIEEPKPMEKPTYDISIVEQYIASFLEHQPQLVLFAEHAELVISQYKERLATAQLLAKKTKFVPIKIPFPWHSFFEALINFLLEELNEPAVCFETIAPTKELLRVIHQQKRDRLWTEANSWNSWYQSLCPSVDSVRVRPAETNSVKEVQETSFTNALWSQFHPTPSTDPNTYASPFTAHRTEVEKIKTPTSQPKTEGRIETREPLSPLQFPPLASPGASPHTNRSSTTNNGKNTTIDTLQDRLKALEARLSKINSNGHDESLGARLTSSKRRAVDEGYSIQPPGQPKRKKD